MNRARRRLSPRTRGLLLGAVAVLVPSLATAQVPVPHEGGLESHGQRRDVGQHGAIAPEDLALPPAPARLWVVAPSPEGPWTLRIDNDGETPLRIPADARLLQLEVVPKGGGKKVTCTVPKAMRSSDFPEDRALVLEPGQSYLEVFDPRLFCFGDKTSALQGGAVVSARFGWDDPPAWAAKKSAKGPFAAAGIDYPAKYHSLRNLEAPPVRLSFTARTPPPADEPGRRRPNAEDAASANDEKHGPDRAPHEQGGERGGPSGAQAADGKRSDAPKPPERIDQNRPRLELDVTRYSDANDASAISLNVTAFNDGRRDMLAALRSRMVAFEVVGPLRADPDRPDPKTECPVKEARYATPREMFQTFKPTQSVSFNLLVAELCPKSTFLRPGLYRVRPVMHATETGAALNLKAFTGTARAIHEALVRVHTGRLPFHKFAPAAIETTRLSGGTVKGGGIPRGGELPGEELEGADGVRKASSGAATSGSDATPIAEPATIPTTDFEAVEPDAGGGDAPEGSFDED